jgi:hypothetical protein
MLGAAASASTSTPWGKCLSRTRASNCRILHCSQSNAATARDIHFGGRKRRQCVARAQSLFSILLVVGYNFEAHVQVFRCLLDDERKPGGKRVIVCRYAHAYRGIQTHFPTYSRDGFGLKELDLLKMREQTIPVSVGTQGLPRTIRIEPTTSSSCLILWLVADCVTPSDFAAPSKLPVRMIAARTARAS